MILLDNNILARLTNDGHPNCKIAREAVHRLLRGGETLVLCPQGIYEFWAVATRTKANNGLELTEVQAAQWIAFFRRRFSFLPDPLELSEVFTALVLTHKVRGFRAHDARYVAFAQTAGITRLLSFNPQDFRGFPITVLDPAAV
jgi:predicted nucleic acid-binding protein